MDGNTKALDLYQKEQDEAAEEEIALEKAQEQFSDDLFEAYFDNNETVIDQVDSQILEEGGMLGIFRKAKLKLDANASARIKAYERVVLDICVQISKRATDVDKLKKYRKAYNL